MMNFTAVKDYFKKYCDRHNLRAKWDGKTGCARLVEDRPKSSFPGVKIPLDRSSYTLEVLLTSPDGAPQIYRPVHDLGVTQMIQFFQTHKDVDPTIAFPCQNGSLVNSTDNQQGFTPDDSWKYHQDRMEKKRNK